MNFFIKHNSMTHLSFESNISNSSLLFPFMHHCSGFVVYSKEGLNKQADVAFCHVDNDSIQLDRIGKSRDCVKGK